MALIEKISLQRNMHGMIYFLNYNDHDGNISTSPRLSFELLGPDVFLRSGFFPFN